MLAESASSFLECCDKDGRVTGKLLYLAYRKVHCHLLQKVLFWNNEERKLTVKWLMLVPLEQP